MAAIVLEKVSKVYRTAFRGVKDRVVNPLDVIAVSEVDLEVQESELLVLVGPSGSGKTTTLRLIAGLERPTSGVVRIGGRVANDLAPRLRDVAMVFQNHALYPHLNVSQNLAFGSNLRSGMNVWRTAWTRLFQADRHRQLLGEREAIDGRVRQVARALGLEDLLHRQPDELSGGERQRVAVGRALVRQPAAFLFDEPLSNLEPKLRSRLREEIRQHKQGAAASMIYVTHDQVEALTLADRVAVMARGKLQQLGTPSEIYDTPRNRFVAEFFGTPPMNFVAGRLDNEKGGLRFTTPHWSTPHWSTLLRAGHAPQVSVAGRGQVVLGLRAEHVSLQAADAVNDETPVVRCRVQTVERLGDVTHVFAVPLEANNQADGQTIVCKAAPRLAVAAGDLVAVGLNLSAAHWFDAVTGDRLMTPSARGRETDNSRITVSEHLKHTIRTTRTIREN